MLPRQLAAIVGTPVKLALSRTPPIWLLLLPQAPPLLCCTCSLGDVRTLSENSAYSTSFSPDIVSSPNSLSSSELSWILSSGWHVFLPLFRCCKSSSCHGWSWTILKIIENYNMECDWTLIWKKTDRISYEPNRSITLDWLCVNLEMKWTIPVSSQWLWVELVLINKRKRKFIEWRRGDEWL